MNKETEILPEKKSLRELLSNYYFQVPHFQRDYCWEIEKWDDFWEDLINQMNEEYDFFLGSIVVKNLKKDANFEIIDGQQRITTISILLAVIRDQLKKNSNPLADEIQYPFIVQKEALRSEQSRLKLNKNDNPFFQKYFVRYTEDINSVRNRGLTKGERLLWKSYKFFKEKIDSYSYNVEPLLSTLLDKTYVILIQVEDDLQAYTVFETLNARGSILTAGDLIKNSILAKASKIDKLDEVNEIWNRIQNNLSSYNITTFLKYQLALTIGTPIREKNLFKKIKKTGLIQNEVYNFVSNLESDSDLYLNLLEPKESYWQDKEMIESLQGINTMRLKTCYPLLMAITKSKLKQGTKSKLIKEVENLGFRYNIVLKNNPNILEKKYAEWANKLIDNKIEVSTLKSEILNIKPSDKDFYDAFLELEIINDSRLSGYILKKIGYLIQGADLLDIKNYASVEHILPKKPTKWKEYIEKNNEFKLNDREVSFDEFTQGITRLIGNQTLLLLKDNNDIENESFEIKKAKVFSNSLFKWNQEISKEKVWSLKEINKYQKKMAELAKKVW